MRFQIGHTRNPHALGIFFDVESEVLHFGDILIIAIMEPLCIRGFLAFVH